MAEQVQKQRQSTKRTEEKTDDKPTKVDAEKLKADLDAILDEIDEVLTEEADAFVRNFVQKGGQAVWVQLHRLGIALSVMLRLSNPFDGVRISPPVGVL